MNKFLNTQLAIAADIWQDIKNVSEPADRWLGNFFHHNRKRIGSRDRRFFAETIYALFRHKTFIDCWQRECGLIKIEQAAPVLAAACESLISLEEFKDELPRIKNPHISIEKLYKDLKNICLPQNLKFDTPEEKISVQYSFPLWLVKRWTDRFGFTRCESLLSSMQRRPALTVRTNILKTSRKDLIQLFQSKGFEVAATQNSAWGITFKERINLFDSEEFREGYFEVQDEGSQIISQKIGARAGEMIWDVCAGGGGKSLAMAATMENKGRIIATDIRAAKLDELKKRARRAGIFNIFPADMKRLDETKEAKTGFDKILIDAPCSGTGTLRRNPDAKWKLTEGKFEVFQSEQIAIIKNALPRLKKGGSLYYVTCSLEADENEGVMKKILQEYPFLQLKPALLSPDGFFQLYPDNDQTDGFFLAVAENKG